MRVLAERTFDSAYLILMTLLGLVMLVFGGGEPICTLFGWMALVLAGGDCVHLASRVFPGPLPPLLSAGAGKWVTSITSAAYYLLLYHVLLRWSRWPIPVGWTVAVWVLFLLRLSLCCLPRNRWLTGGASTSWAVARNVPFLLMGAVVAGLSTACNRAAVDPVFRLLPLAIALSFLFYLPVVLFASKKPTLGMLMIPKTLAYLWIQWMGLSFLP